MPSGARRRLGGLVGAARRLGLRSEGSRDLEWWLAVVELAAVLAVRLVVLAVRLVVLVVRLVVLVVQLVVLAVRSAGQ